MQDLANYAKGQQLCKIMRAHNRIIPRSLLEGNYAAYAMLTVTVCLSLDYYKHFWATKIIKPEL